MLYLSEHLCLRQKFKAQMLLVENNHTRIFYKNLSDYSQWVSESSTVNCSDASVPETEREGLVNLKGEEETSVTIYSTKIPEPDIADVTESESIIATEDHEEQSKDRSKGMDEETENQENQSVTDKKIEASSQENTNDKTEEGIIVSAEEIKIQEKETEDKVAIRKNGQDEAVHGHGVEDLGKAEATATSKNCLISVRNQAADLYLAAKLQFEF
eukprot:gene8771-14797_t